MSKELTTQEKVSIVIDSEEVKMAVKMLIVLMEDNNIQNYVTTEYELGDCRYELSFTKKLINKILD